MGTVDRAGAPARGRRLPGRWAVVLRSLAIQAAFNPVTLQGAGFARALLPELSRAHGTAAGRRAAELAGGFNANPYLAPFAIGAVAVAEGVEPTTRIDRFLGLARGPLGSLGDSLFWGAARPAVLIPAALAVAAGAPWWVALAALVPFNALAFAARLSGARAGLARGLDVAAALGGSWIRSIPSRIRVAGALTIGTVAGLVLCASVSGRAGLSGPGGGASGAPSGWAALAVFSLALPLFALWPRRLGWGLALLAAWALVAGLAH